MAKNQTTVHEDGSDHWVTQASQNRDAFGKLFDLFYPKIFAYCSRRLLVRAIAEDVTSEIFLTVVQAIQSFPGSTMNDFRRWLFRIATNEINAQLRKSIRRKTILDAAVQMGAVGQEFSRDVMESDVTVQWVEVYQAIESLSERDQAIVSLKFFGHQTYDEIGDVLETEPGTVRVALSRALDKLRSRLAHEKIQTTTGKSIKIAKGEDAG